MKKSVFLFLLFYLIYPAISYTADHNDSFLLQSFENSEWYQGRGPRRQPGPRRNPGGSRQQEGSGSGIVLGFFCENIYQRLGYDVGYKFKQFSVMSSVYRISRDFLEDFSYGPVYDSSLYINDYRLVDNDRPWGLRISLIYDLKLAADRASFLGVRFNLGYGFALSDIEFEPDTYEEPTQSYITGDDYLRLYTGLYMELGQVFYLESGAAIFYYKDALKTTVGDHLGGSFYMGTGFIF